MTMVQHPLTLMGQNGIIADLERRLVALERCLQTSGKVAAYDANGVLRALVGPLDDAGGGYAGQFGLVVKDSTGSPILDNQGLIKVGKDLAPQTFAQQLANAFTTTPTDVPNTQTPTFTLSRAENLLILCSTTFVTSGGTANYGYLWLGLYTSGGVLVSNAPPAQHTNGSGVSNAGLSYFVPAVAAGSYYVKLQYSMNAGATTTMDIGHLVSGPAGTINVIQLGG